MNNLYILPALDNAIALKLTNEDFMIVNSKKGLDEKENFKCTFEAIAFEQEFYEIIFKNDNVIETLIENEKYIPYNIEQNCKKCHWYDSCLETKLLSSDKENVNKILEEYHDFIKNIISKK